MTYAGITWDPRDLIGCKNAVRILFNRGVAISKILSLDFGSLDVEAVLDEMLDGKVSELILQHMDDGSTWGAIITRW